MQHFVLGTAGHVDHGKTSLIKALTGIDTDRLKEEKKRGITIELGFASLHLPSGLHLGIVDVPGHEKFIRHMVAGAAGIDLVLLVIAADEGVMPQTKEHLQICSLLGITTGLVALTKIDLVEKDWLDLVRSEIDAYLKDTFLSGAPVIPVSSVREEGLQEILSAIDTTVTQLKEKKDDGIFRLPVDRIFTMKGFGTVVTGTLISDKICVGEDIQILPQSISARIRGLQVHNQTVGEAFSGQRTAVNLQGIEKSSLERGNILARPQTVWPTRRMDVFFEYLPANTRKLKNRSLVRLHTGTTEIITRIVMLDKDEMAPGEKGFAQLLLEQDDVVIAGDHFVLRSYSPVTTIGGGRILDPQPGKHKRNHKKTLRDLEILQTGTLAQRISVILDRAGFEGATVRRLAYRLGANVKKIREVLEKLFSDKQAILLASEDTLCMSSGLYAQLEQVLIQNIEDYHRTHPLKEGISKEEFKAALPASVSAKLFNLLLSGLTKKKILAGDKESVRLATHSVQLAGEENELRDAIAAKYMQAGLAPPSLADVLGGFQDRKAKAQNIVKLMLSEGKLVKINEELYFDRAALDTLRENYKNQLIRDGRATPATFKDLTGLSRKYIIPLMEYFDAARLTIRVADHRILREKT